MTGAERDQLAAAAVEVEGKLSALRLAIGSKKRTAADVEKWLEEAREAWYHLDGGPPTEPERAAAVQRRGRRMTLLEATVRFKRPGYARPKRRRK